MIMQLRSIVKLSVLNKWEIIGNQMLDIVNAGFFPVFIIKLKLQGKQDTVTSKSIHMPVTGTQAV